MLGSIAIAVNSLAGPAILQLPFQYQQSVSACVLVSIAFSSHFPILIH